MERSLLQYHDETIEQDEEEFKRYFAELEDEGVEIRPENIDPHIWQNTYWDRMDPDTREEYLVQLIRPTLERARTQGIYAQSDTFMEADPDNIDTLDDILREYPVLTKDGENGFRQYVAKDPNLMLPEQREEAGVMIWESGGSGGVPTPTYLSDQDMEVDASGLTRAFAYGAIEEGDTLLNGYNPSHKGGRAIFRAMELMDGKAIPMRPEEDADDVVNKMKRYDIDALAAVETGQGVDKKSGGKNFFGLLSKDYDAVIDIDKWFVTGYPLVDDLVDLSEAYPVEGDDGSRNRLFTTYGTSEAIPLATSTSLPDNGPAQYNAQHLLLGPHHVSVAVEEDGELRPAKEGERGMALVTTIDRRDGTIYVNYAIGDAITVESYNPEDSELTTPLISNIEKVDDPMELLEGGCAVV